MKKYKYKVGEDVLIVDCYVSDQVYLGLTGKIYTIITKSKYPYGVKFTKPPKGNSPICSFAEKYLQLLPKNSELLNLKNKK